MTRGKKLMLNSVTSVLYQIITFICGFILPRIFLSTYGSAVNGLVSSITQFLGFISLCEMGVGAVVQSALYKPLADKDSVEVSKIAISSERFFRKIAYILLVYTAVLMLIYPIITIDKFDYVFTMLLILVISISTFARYYFGITYRLIFSADQLAFVHFGIHSVALILNTVACIFLMSIGASIHIVKLTTSIIFLLQPVILNVIARERYKIDRKIVFSGEPIKQKWNGLAQHIAAVVLGNTDIVVLTLFSSLENVSVYAVYHLVVNGVRQIFISLTNGMQAMMGNMLAKKEMKILNNTFEFFEWLIHTAVTLIFYVTAALILAFVSVYTRGIRDVNYIVPAFAYLITLSQALVCLQLPYKTLVLAAGHYKETQLSSIIEAAINIILSVILVFNFGLIGVAIGTIVAIIYRLVYLVWYLSKNIMRISMIVFAKKLIVDIICIFVFIASMRFFKPFFTLNDLSYVSWFYLAMKVGLLCLVESIFLNMIFCKKNMYTTYKKICTVLKRRKLS